MTIRLQDYEVTHEFDVALIGQPIEVGLYTKDENGEPDQIQARAGGILERYVVEINGNAGVYFRGDGSDEPMLKWVISESAVLISYPAHD